MIVHDIVYEWDGKSHNGEKPIAWWPGSYRVKIIKPGRDTDDVAYMFPWVVVFKNTRRTDTAMNVSLRNYIHNFAEKISKKFDFSVDKAMWIELADPTMVAHLNPERKLDGRALFEISWRDIRPNEQEMIAPFIQDM